MSALPIRDQIIRELDALSDDQIITVLEFIHSVKDVSGSAGIDTDDDPLIGFISGSTDVAHRTKDILRDEITSRSGWTQKD